MELSEAKIHLEQLKKDLSGYAFVYGDFDKKVAIETLLNYIENKSISKEKIREKIKTIEDIPGLTTANESQIEILEELLGR